MDPVWSDEGIEARFEAYVEGLAGSLGRKDREGPFRDYCAGLLIPGDRKSVEPMAARLDPAATGARHQSLLHFVGQAAWDEKALLRAVREAVLPVMTGKGPVVAWVVDDTSFPKKGRHSVGVARQYCGQLGKTENCQTVVSLSVATGEQSLPVAWQLYLPEEWAADFERCREAKAPDNMPFLTKPEISLLQIRSALEEGVEPGVVLADSGYGKARDFREALCGFGLNYVVGILGSIRVWPVGRVRTVSPEGLARKLPARAWREVSWREGVDKLLTSRFAARRVRDGKNAREQWLLIEWPEGEDEPSRYWLSNLPADIPLDDLVRLTKHRWVIERDYLELKQEVGLGHYEGRGWPGFHHHMALATAAYGFLAAERAAFPPSGPKGSRLVEAPALPEGYRPRGAAPAYPAPRPKLNRNAQCADCPETGPETQPMSMLRTISRTGVTNKAQFVTQ